MHCSVIEHGMMSLSFQTAAQKNEAKLNLFQNLFQSCGKTLKLMVLKLKLEGMTKE